MNRFDLKSQLRLHEGIRFSPYPCSAGQTTIGVGWNMDARRLPSGIAKYLKLHGCITPEMVDELLEMSIDSAVSDCRQLFPAFVSFSDVRQHALIDVVFNLGKAKISKGFPSFCHAVNIGDWQGAADELKYADGRRKTKLSLYWTQLHGDPDGQDDRKRERPETIYRMLVEG